MGTSSSTLTLEGVASLVLAVGLVSAYYLLGSKSAKDVEEGRNNAAAESPPTASKGKKGKGKKGTATSGLDNAATTKSAPAPAQQLNLPGGNEIFSPRPEAAIQEEDAAAIIATLDAAKTAKAKRKKGKKAANTKAIASNSAASKAVYDSSGTSTPAVTEPLVPVRKLTSESKKQQSSVNRLAPVPMPMDDESEGSQWTRINRNKKSATKAKMEDSITTNTGTEEPATSSEPTSPVEVEQSHKTLAEKLTPKPRKTGVEDMLEKPDQPKLARVMHIKPENEPSHKTPVETPSESEEGDMGGDSGFSPDPATDTDGFVTVASKGRRRAQRSSSSNAIEGGSNAPLAKRSPEGLTKRQRQNQTKKEREKEAKALQNQEQQMRLAAHKKELEKARISDVYGSGQKKKSGGMSMHIDANGKAVWE